MSLSNASGPVLWTLDQRGVATVTLNRPEVNNAYNGDLIQGLLNAIDALAGAPTLRAVVLKGNGRHFQAGADLAWISGVAKQSPQENEAVSRLTAEAIRRLDTCPVPTVALMALGLLLAPWAVMSATAAEPAAGAAAEGAAEAVSWQDLHAGNEVSNISSLQEGARNFTNYCLGCHSMKSARVHDAAAWSVVRPQSGKSARVGIACAQFAPPSVLL